MYTFLLSLWHLVLEMSPYLLLGFGIAGILYAFVPATAYRKYLSRPGFRSVANATLLGIPLPLCSCGVLPTAVSLRRSGASRGACTSFLIATPQTGVDSILATYSLLGLPFALLRPVAALVTGILGGVVTDLGIKEEKARPAVEETAPREVPALALGFGGKLRKAFAYAFSELLEDVGRWLVIGLVVAAAITVLVPEGFFVTLQQWPLLNMLLVLLIAIPMYVCATGSIPIALSLLLKGMTPGAAFVLLMAGPAINAASMLVIERAFGRRQTVIYILSIVAGAISFGLFIDHFLPAAWFVPQALTHAASCAGGTGSEASLWQMACAAIFLFLLVRAVFLRYARRSSCQCRAESSCGCHGEPGRGEAGNGEIHKGGEAHGEPSLLVLKVSGMRCSHCVANVRGALMGLPFVEDVEVDLAVGTVKVAPRPGMSLRVDLVCQEVEKSGYSVQDSFLQANSLA